MPTQSCYMFQPITGLSSGESNTKHATEGNIKMKEISVLRI